MTSIVSMMLENMGCTTRSLSRTPYFVVIHSQCRQNQIFLLICPLILPYIRTHRLGLFYLHLLLCLLNLLPIFCLRLVYLSWIWRHSNRLRLARSFTLSSEYAGMKFQGVGRAVTRVVTMCTWADFKAWLWSQVVRDRLAFPLGVAHAAAFFFQPLLFIGVSSFWFSILLFALLAHFCRSWGGPVPV